VTREDKLKMIYHLQRCASVANGKRIEFNASLIEANDTLIPISSFEDKDPYSCKLSIGNNCFLFKGKDLYLTALVKRSMKWLEDDEFYYDFLLYANDNFLQEE